MEMTIEIQGKEYAVIGYVRDEQGRNVPLLDLPMMSDYKWQLGCLNDRLNDPQKYRDKGEDVEATIERLRQWLAEHEYMNDKKKKKPQAATWSKRLYKSHKNFVYYSMDLKKGQGL